MGGGGEFHSLYLLLPLPVPFNPLPAPFLCGSILFVPFLLRNITKCCERFLNYFQFPLPVLSFPASRPFFSRAPALLSSPTIAQLLCYCYAMYYTILHISWVSPGINIPSRMFFFLLLLIRKSVVVVVASSECHK